jgi:methylated-DNA-protein-cysteine methyltransferase-like protein
MRGCTSWRSASPVRERGPARPATRPSAAGGRFHAAVYGLVRQIPRGQVATYGQLAALLGWPRAARAVGYAMKRCPAGLPWHRVVNAQGAISARANVAGMMTQRVLLEQEGVPVRRGRIRLAQYRWPGPRRSRQPGLAALSRL